MRRCEHFSWCARFLNLSAGRLCSFLALLSCHLAHCPWTWVLQICREFREANDKVQDVRLRTVHVFHSVPRAALKLLLLPMTLEVIIHHTCV